MRKLLLAAALISNFAIAADWQVAGIADSVVVQIDMSSIVKQGPMRKAWTMWNYANDKATDDYEKKHYRSSKVLVYFDCANRRSMGVQSTLYAGEFGQGESVRSYKQPFNDRAMDEVVPDTVGETNLTAVCSYRFPGKAAM